MVFQQPAKSFITANTLLGRAPFVLSGRKQDPVLLALVVPLRVEMSNILRQLFVARLHSNRISLDRHRSFTDRTYVSANAFKFGLWGGSRTGRTPAGRSTIPEGRTEFRIAVAQQVSLAMKLARFFVPHSGTPAPSIPPSGARDTGLLLPIRIRSLAKRHQRTNSARLSARLGRRRKGRKPTIAMPSIRFFENAFFTNAAARQSAPPYSVGGGCPSRLLVVRFASIPA